MIALGRLARISSVLGLLVGGCVADSDMDTCFIRGQVVDEAGQPVAGIEIGTSRKDCGAVTDLSGSYYIKVYRYATDLYIFPSRDGVFFSPGMRYYDQVEHSMDEQKFVQLTPDHTISGAVRDSEGGPVGCTIDVSCAQELFWRHSVRTGDDGRYITAGIVAGYDYTLEPRSYSGRYDPPSRSYEAVAGDYYNQDFTLLYRAIEIEIRGRICDPDGTPLRGVLVVFESSMPAQGDRLEHSPEGWPPQETYLTDRCGYYRFWIWSDRFPGFIIPSEEGCTFEPALREYPVPVDEHWFLNQDFTAFCDEVISP